MTSQNNDYFKPEVFLLSDDSELSENLKAGLLSNKCKCVPITINGDTVELEKYLNQQTLSGRNYFLAILNDCGKYNKIYTNSLLNEIVRFVESTDSKTIVTFPYSYFAEHGDFYEYWNRSILENNKIYAGTVFLGDVLSHAPDSAPASLLDEVLSEPYRKAKNPGFNSNLTFNPLTPEAASAALISSLFSMGAYRTSTAIIGNEHSLETLLEKMSPDRGTLLRSAKKTLAISHLKSLQQTRMLNVDILKLLEERKELMVKLNTKENKLNSAETRVTIFSGFINTIRKMKKVFQKRDVVSEFIKSNHSLLFKKKSNNPQTKENVNSTSADVIRPINIFKIGLLVILLTFMPHILLLLAKAALFTSNYLIGASFMESSLRVGQFSLNVTDGARNLSLIYMKIPLAGKYYEKPFQDSEFLIKVTDLQMAYRVLIERVADFINLSGNSNSGDSTIIAKDISLEIDGIYSKTGFLEGEWVNNDSKKENMIKRLFPGGDSNDVKNKLLDLKKITDQSDMIFGVVKPMNYLILFEDNSQIRPTGGKIDAFGIVTFTDAKISNIQILNFEDVDQKVEGKIDPPDPLKTYFGKNSWYLSDSNWYVDFPSSAEKAEWFLDKGLDIPVDGVISFDSTAISEISKTIKKSPPDLESSDKEELKEFMQSINNSDRRQTYKLIFQTVDLLNKKHILVFSHNNETRSALNALGWDGSIKDVDCMADCYLDAMGIIESANGIGSENIKKEVSLNISVEEGLTKKTLNIFMENKNNFDYKTYLRVLSGSNSGFSPVNITTQDEKQQKYPEIYGVSGYKEAGVYLEFKPLETKAVSFSWENAIDDFTNMNRYTVLFRKQPGEQSYPLEVGLENKSKSLEKSSPVYSLTGDGKWSYNTDLLSDFVSTFVWKK